MASLSSLLGPLQPVLSSQFQEQSLHLPLAWVLQPLTQVAIPLLVLQGLCQVLHHEVLLLPGVGALTAPHHLTRWARVEGACHQGARLMVPLACLQECIQEC